VLAQLRHRFAVLDLCVASPFVARAFGSKQGDNGVVTLTGTVRKGTGAARLGDAACRIPGVIDARGGTRPRAGPRLKAAEAASAHGLCPQEFRLRVGTLSPAPQGGPATALAGWP
jgi:hypothetical protein